ncbi:tryptophan synthase subunit alpha [Streptomyces sp. NBC_01717]|uniref:tryptophan synthase subunit alpha n=1 Tax=Streptomyces sp. NBC_01717 TaxID=2975918 RepID=UPI002E34C151|nr:tryptophan synthase subunit alpha [Streptomyces sp. NBC_01717]
MSDVRLHLVPVRSREAKDFVRAWHRQHPPPTGQTHHSHHARATTHSTPERHCSRDHPDSTGRTPALTSGDRTTTGKGTTLTTDDPLHTLLTQPACSLGVFVPAGMHTATAERRHLDALAHAGCALFEIGLAHHTAVLDGPVIQSAYRRALQSGSILDRTLRAVEHAASLRPTVVMTYWEPVSRHGPAHLARLLAEAGATGVMVVDLPSHQAARWQAAAQGAGLRTPRLVPRHTTDTDLANVVAGASGWLYAPASIAPTGYQGPLDIPALSSFTQRLRAASPLPVVSGVGISAPGLAARVAPLVDAVVIGTPIVRALATAPGHAPVLAAAFARALRLTSLTESRA